MADQSGERYRRQCQTLMAWVQAMQAGRTFDTYFLSHGYKNIALYGFGDMGEMFIKAIEGTEIRVRYGIDEKQVPVEDIDVYRPDQSFPPADCIVVTPTFAFEEIKNNLAEKTDIPLVSMDEVICSA